MDAERCLTRRAFLARAGAAAAVAAWPGRAGAKILGANARVNIAFIGCGGRGTHLSTVLAWLQDQAKEPIEFVAACDVYLPRARRFNERHGGKLKIYQKSAELLADPAIDAVVVATPDHHHVPQTIAAVQAGKHVYCEKPISHWRQIEPLREMFRVVSGQKECAVQCGMQGLSCSAWAQARELIRQGRIGAPVHAECAYFRVGDWGERGMAVDDPNCQEGPEMDWRGFLGDAPRRPYSVDRHFRWRLFMDYAGGPVTDLYPHSFSPIVKAMGLGLPRTAVALGGQYRYKEPPREVPDTYDILLQYPGDFNVLVKGTQANQVPGFNGYPNGVQTCDTVIRGTDGTLTFPAGQIRFSVNDKKDDKEETWKVDTKTDEAEFMKNWLAAARSGDLASLMSPIEIGYRTQLALLMGMKAFTEKRYVTYDEGRDRLRW